MSTPNEPLTATQAESLVAPSEPWFSCDDCFDHIDSVVDGLLSDGRPLGEPMRVHLARCSACCEEAESLISLSAADQGRDAGQMLDAFRTELGPSPDAQGEPEPKNAIARLFRRAREAGGPVGR